MNRHQLIAALHAKVAPRTYLETGVHKGQSLTLSRVPSIGIDPDFAIVEQLQADVYLARTSSDEFFAREDPMASLPIPVVDLAFIDGMHLAEYALRDIIAVERFTLPTSVIVIDDMLPSRVPMANRTRTTGAWTGDVYKAAEALRELRPDLLIIEVNTTGSGTAVVLFPDATRDGVLPGYDEWVSTVIAPDPQPVPSEILTRSRAMKPEVLLASPGWAALAGLRGKAKPGDDAAVRDAFSDLVKANAALVD